MNETVEIAAVNALIDWLMAYPKLPERARFLAALNALRSAIQYQQQDDYET